MLSWIVAAEFCLSLSSQLFAETLCLCQCCCCYCFSCCCCCCLLRLLLLVASYSLMPLHSLCEWNDASMDKQHKKFVNLQSIVTELTVDIPLLSTKESPANAQISEKRSLSNLQLVQYLCISQCIAQNATFSIFF